jgi:ribosomal-protein-alanine N-acetyltransferase
MSRRSSREESARSRVYLRRPTEADRDEYCELLRVSESFLRAWSPAPPPDRDPYSAAAFLEYVRSSGPAARRERRLVCRASDDCILGAISIGEIVRGCFQSAYLGYWIGAPFAQQGYMREALPLVVKLAFGELGLHRLEANIRPENEPSIRLVRGANFHKEGYSPRYLKIDGEWRDHERWTILADGDSRGARAGEP